MDWPLIGRDAILRELAATLASGSVRGVEIVGAPGVGKTRLANELARVLTGPAASIVSVQGSQATMARPFGAFAEILPEDLFLAAASGGEPRLLDAIVTPGAILVVDDAHLLDPRSHAVLRLAALKAKARIILTRLAGDHRAPILTGLWKDGLVARHDLAPLTEQATQGLVEHMLDGPVDPRSIATVWRLSEGYPLFVRELVLGALASGAIVRESGEWRARRELTPSSRLVELVNGMLGPLVADERLVVETVAVGESICLADLEELVPGPAIDAIEERRITRTATVNRQVLVRMAHPIYGEVVRSSIPIGRRRARTRWAADHLERRGLRRSEDVLQLARWRLDLGASLEPAFALVAAKRALTVRDAGLAERLATAALEDAQASIPARILLGEALAIQQRFDEAHQILEAASAAARTDDEIGRVALVRADLLYYRAGRTPEAVAVLEEALATLVKPDWRDDLEALLQTLRSGGVAHVDARPWDGARLPSVGNRARVLHALTHSVRSSIMAGRFLEAERQISAALSPSPELALDHPFTAETLRILAVQADLYSGRADRALAAAQAGFRAAVEAGASEGTAAWATVLSEAQALTGNVEAGLRTVLGAVGALRGGNTTHVQAHHVAWASTLASWLDQPAQARTLWQQLSVAGAAVDVRTRIPIDRASVWLTWIESGSRAAAAEARAAGERAAQEDRPVWSAFLFHDAVRLGHPDLVRKRLAALADAMDGDLVQLMASHANALVARDSRGLEEVASRFEALGLLLFAAETLAQAQLAYVRSGEPRLARLAAPRVAALVARCGTVRTPAFTGATSVPLTQRELDVARLAIRGEQSREIAERLGISVRTVDNHLGSIYAKLGISHREELPSVLGAEGMRVTAAAAS